MPPTQLNGLAVRALWVVDRPIITARIHYGDNRHFEYPSTPMEWPIRPLALRDWKDVLHEGIGVTLSAGSLF